MNIVFNKIKNLIPYKLSIKEKDNNELLIVENENLDIYYLNETSKFFYNLCDGTNSINDIFNNMLQYYDVSYDELSDDIINLIRDMQWNNIINLKEKTI